MEHILHWIEGHPGLAGWVQAVGSILALIATYMITNGQNKQARKSALIQVCIGYLQFDRDFREQYEAQLVETADHTFKTLEIKPLRTNINLVSTALYQHGMPKRHEKAIRQIYGIASQGYTTKSVNEILTIMYERCQLICRDEKASSLSKRIKTFGDGVKTKFINEVWINIFK